MEVLLVLIPVSIALAAASVVACLVAIRAGQYDDMESPKWRILFDPPGSTGRPGAAKADRAGLDDSKVSEQDVVKKPVESSGKTRTRTKSETQMLRSTPT